MAHLRREQLQELRDIDSSGEGIREELHRFIIGLTSLSPVPTVNVGYAPDGSGSDRCAVDLDAFPFLPDQWSVQAHRKGGVIDLAAANVIAVAPDEMVMDDSTAWEVARYASRLALLNHNALEAYVRRPDLVPESFVGRAVYFLGTRYLDESGNAKAFGLRFRSAADADVTVKCMDAQWSRDDRYAVLQL